MCWLGGLCCVCGVPGLLFTGVLTRCFALRVRAPGPLGSCSPVCMVGVLCWGRGVLGFSAPVHRCACSSCCVVCTVSWATWLLFTGVLARCFVSCVRCPGQLGSCSPVCPLGCLCRVCGVLGLVFTGVLPRWVVLRVRCPGPIGCCSPVCWLGALCSMCGVLGHWAPVHLCARSVHCVACAVSWTTWLLFTCVPARCILSHGCVACAVSWATGLLFTCVPAWCVVSRVRCPGPLGSCSPVCSPAASRCVCHVLGLLAPVHRCAGSVCCVARVRCPGSPGSCSPVCSFGVFCCLCTVSLSTGLLFSGVTAPCVVLCCVCGVLGHRPPVHRCACSVGCAACAVSSASWLLCSGVLAQCFVLRGRSPGELDSCSTVCPLGALFCVCGVLGHLAPVHRCAHSVLCAACAVSSATWLLFTGVLARCFVLRVRCPRPLGSCSPVCPLGALSCMCGVWGLVSLSPVCLLGASCCVCGVLGHLAPVHRGARSVRCFACAVSGATCLLFTCVLARCFLLHVRCPGPLGSCSPVRPLGALCCVCRVLGHLAPVHGCDRSVPCFACAVSWATWILSIGVHTWCVVLRVRCPGPLGSCSPVCPLGALSCICGVWGHLSPFDPCACSVLLAACAVSWATWLLFTGAPARCVVLRVPCPGPLGSCSRVCPLGALFCMCGVLGHLDPVHRLHTWCVILCVRCHGPLHSCALVCSLCVFCCTRGVLGHLALVHRCARLVCCAVCCVCDVACAALRRGAQSPPSGRRLFVAGRGWLPSGRALVHPDCGCFIAGRGWVRCRARTRPSGRRPVLLGTCSRAVVLCVLCALSRFAAPGGRCCLASVRVPWLWPAACLSGVPRGPAWCAAPRPVRLLSVLRSAFRDAVVPLP